MTRPAASFTADAFAVEDNTAFKQRVLALQRETPWEQIEDRHQRALVMLVRDALLLLAAQPAKWLADVVVAAPVGHVALLIDFDLHDVDIEVTERHAAATRSSLEREAHLAAILEELKDAHTT